MHGGVRGLILVAVGLRLRPFLCLYGIMCPMDGSERDFGDLWGLLRMALGRCLYVVWVRVGECAHFGAFFVWCDECCDSLV